MSEEEEYIRSLPEDRLQTLLPELKKWGCCVEGCDHFTRVQDFGIHPVYRWRKKFFNVVDYVFYCGKHWRQMKVDPNSIIRTSEFSELMIRDND